ncbi:MAG: LysR family transcriptional regulator [Acidobacteriaceae bacterium]|nr:LysR family transcriptional regulator [Acidobacteriaceae bacterium]
MSIYDYLEFRHLRFIVAVAEELNMTRAAERLNVVQSNLSKQISDIEELFHVKLFNRVRNGVQLTSAGQSLYIRAKQLLELREETINSLQAVQDAETKPFRLGFSQFVEHAVLQTVSQAYREMFPKGVVDLEGDDTDVLLKRLESGELDAALITLPFSIDRLCSQALFHERMVVCLCKDDPLAQMGELEAPDLNGRLGIFSDAHHHPAAHARLLEMLNEQRITPRTFSPAFSLEQIQWMVGQRMCLALIREHEVLHESLTTRPIRGVQWTIDSAIIYRQKDNHGAISLLLRDLARRYPNADANDRRKPPQSVKEETSLFQHEDALKNA